jgi:hypothetical protein
MPFFKTIYFPSGLPKIHEHDGRRPQAFGILSKVDWFYTFECDLGDGWESPRYTMILLSLEKKLKMGANIYYIFKTKIERLY